jgi:hypothetical protein
MELYPNPEIISGQGSFLIHGTETEEEEIDRPLNDISTWSFRNNMFLHFPSPVYVEKNERGKDQRIIYKSSLMYMFLRKFEILKEKSRLAHQTF